MKVRKRGAWAMLFFLLTLTAEHPASTAGRDDIVHTFGYIAMKDGTQISYTLYRPSAQGRFPTLLVYNMYDASAVAPNWNQTVSTEVSDYLEAGFAVMGANVRGTACSSGSLDPLDAEQVGRDGAEVGSGLRASRGAMAPSGCSVTPGRESPNFTWRPRTPPR